MAVSFEEVKGVLELLGMGAIVGFGWRDLSSLKNSHVELKSSVSAIKHKLHNGMSEALVRIETKVDALPCVKGECKK